MDAVSSYVEHALVSSTGTSSGILCLQVLMMVRSPTHDKIELGLYKAGYAHKGDIPTVLFGKL